MSTRWQISAKLSDGMCGCIYVHCDGYPEFALTTLTRHYSEQKKIDQLIALGDCLSIGKEIEQCDPFSSRDDEVWDEIKPSFGETLSSAADEHRHGDEEYRYTWDGISWYMAML